MVCEKYSKLITDEALDGLSLERGADLREHLAHCVSCREEFDHAKNLADAMDRGVGMLVAGEPSPQFASRLRARIANEPGPARLDWRAWIPVAGGAFVLSTVLMALMIRAQRPVSREGETLGQIPRQSEVVVPSKAEGAPARDNRQAPRSKYHAVKSDQPEVLVPPEQLLAVMQLASAMNQGRIDGEQIVVAQQKSEQPLEIEAIQIAPLSIPQLDDANGTSEIPGGY